MQTTDVREAAQGAIDQSKSFVSRQIDDRSTVIGQQIGSVAENLRTVGDQLRENAAVAPAADLVDHGAALVTRLGTYLENADTEQLVGDLETIARRQPWIVAGGALVLGFAASRFLKTSSARRYYGAGSASEGYGTSVYGRDGYDAS